MKDITIGQNDVIVSAGDAALEGVLTIPDYARAVVAFAHGSGSSRFSSRNQYVARTLNERGLGTLLFDLLTVGEHEEDQRDAHLRFDIGLLSRRLTGAVDWLREQEMMSKFQIGLFGASTGAAAALIAAAERPRSVGAAVSRGGRPDLAAQLLPKVKAPTLLLVGGNDPTVLELNQKAAQSLTVEHQIEVIPGASHLFEEPGALEKVADLAADWFQRYLLEER